MEEDEDFEAFEARQRAEAAMKSKEQEDYDKAQGKDEDGDGETEEYDSEYGSSYDSEEGDDDLERDPVSGELLDKDGSSGEKGGKQDLRKSRLTQQDYNKRA